MIYCSSCVMPNTKPGVFLDENGECNACRQKKIKKNINWDQRELILKRLTDKIKASNYPFYDCIVPVSGGKDSWFQAIMLSEKYKLKTLCVSLAAHLPTTEGINNLNNMIKDLNVDHIKITLKPSAYKDIRKKCFLEQGEPNWAEHMAVFSAVVNTALIYEVPLIVWGEDIATEFGGKNSDLETPNALKINENDLVAGKEIEDWLDKDISKRDTFFYKYPSYEKLNQFNIQSIYLSQYVNWYGRKNYEIVKKRGFSERKLGNLSGNYINYDNIDEKLCEINIWFKYLKFGFWRSTDQCCYDIWNNRLSREDAVKIVTSISDQFPKEYFLDFLNFHKLSKEEFWNTVEKFRNKKIWELVNGEWKLKNHLK